jgi:type II secretory pathway pseudopilin PulG
LRARGTYTWSSLNPIVSSRRRAGPIPKRLGVTLLEVLVATGTIVLLASLLVPFLREAETAAKRLTCRQNLKTIAFGLMTYAEDYAGRLAPTVQRYGVRERPDLSVNILYHRELGFDLTRMLGPYVSAKALMCPEPPDGALPASFGDAETVYSNYLFVWGSLSKTPDEGYDRIEDAPGWATAVTDLTWSMYPGDTQIHSFNHLKTRSIIFQVGHFIAGGSQDFSGKQYTSPTLRAIHSLNAAFFDGSSQSLRRSKEWRVAGPLNQADLCDSRVVLPARYR